jgi:hypothetical protein
MITGTYGRFDAVVIGAGANGLVAAAALGRAGKRVLLVDGASAIGGQSRTSEFAPGFKSAPFAIDAGWVPPTVARGLGLGTIPAMVPKYSVTVATGDREFLALARDPARAGDSIRKYSVREADRYGTFVAGLRRLSGFLEELYQLPAPDIDTTATFFYLPGSRNYTNDAELTDHLGYEKHDPTGHNSGNSRNGNSRKKLKGDFGEIDLDTPRDRNGTFEPKKMEVRIARPSEGDQGARTVDVISTVDASDCIKPG